MVYGFPQTKFFETFVALATQKGLSPSVAAEKAGLNRSAVTTWKKGRIPGEATLSKLSAYFGVEREYFLTVDEPLEPQPQGRQEKAGVSTVYGKTGVIIVTENNAGEPYVITADTLQDILDDRTGGRKFVPADGARVFFASQGGKPISPYEYHDFSSLLLFLRGTAKQSD